jgi:hypothetical protein
VFNGPDRVVLVGLCRLWGVFREIYVGSFISSIDIDIDIDIDSFRLFSLLALTFPLVPG